MKTPAPPRSPHARHLGAAAFEAHPIPTVVADAAFHVVYANAAARRLLGASDGARLGDVLSCTEPHAPGTDERCPGCAFHRSVERALAGESTRERGFAMRSGAGGEPADLHLIAFAAPFDLDGAPHAILAVADANALLADPHVVRVCEGCGRVQDEEGGWHPLHRYLEDQLALEAGGHLCDRCDPRDGG